MSRAIAADVVVIGAGPNGLVAANVLADAGLSVLVLEAQPEPGGGVRSGSGLGEGLVVDHCSAFYPLVAFSPTMKALHLEEHGLVWRHAAAVLATPRPDAEPALLWRDLERTAAGLDGDAAGDGGAWRALCAEFSACSKELARLVLGPFPPLRAAAGLVRRASLGGALRLLRLGLLPARRLAEERFAGEAAALLIAGCALHADLGVDGDGSAFYGFLLAMLGQHVGFPVPEGGASSLTKALVRRLVARGGELSCSSAVRKVLIEGGRAVGVETASGLVRARHAVLAAVDAPQLYRDLVGAEHLPAGLLADLDRFVFDPATVKVDWLVAGGIPWRSPAVGAAAAVHLLDHVAEGRAFHTDLLEGRLPARPFVLLGQAGKADAGRAPEGSEVVWAYTRLPRRLAGGSSPSARDVEELVGRMEARIEEHAPGFAARVTARSVLGPAGLETSDAAMSGGAINGGTSALFQQLVLRPVPGLGRPETPVEGLYLASSSAHPGGGVHGACGANAARAVVASRHPVKRLVSVPAWRLARRAVANSQLSR